MCFFKLKKEYKNSYTRARITMIRNGFWDLSNTEKTFNMKRIYFVFN